MAENNDTRTTIVRFLDAIFGPALDNNAGVIVLWTPRAQAHALSNINEAATLALRWNTDRRDVYVGTCIYKPTLQNALRTNPRRRGKAADVIALVALWLDIDQKAENKVGGLQDPAAFLDKLPLSPSVVVGSGHGLHAWWLLDEPFVLQSHEDRSHAKGITQRWYQLARDLASLENATLDPTYDLARVLRVPGTTNWKDPEHPCPVELLRCDDGRRYPLSDIEQVLDITGAPITFEATVDVRGEEQKQGQSQSATHELLALDAPPFEKFQALMANNPKFRQTWECKRADLKDASPSGYDLALASMAAAVDWTDAEIAALLRAWRKTHALDVKKAQRIDYLQRTIARARTANIEEERREEQATAWLDLAQIVKTVSHPPTEAQRQAILGALSRMWGIEIIGWRQYGREGMTAEYTLVIRDHDQKMAIPIGRVQAVINQQRFRAAIYVAMRKMLPPLAGRGRKWETVCEALALIAEVIEDVELSEVALLNDHLEQYLQVHPPLVIEPDDADEKYRMISTQHPWHDGETVWISLSAFRKWLAVAMDTRLTMQSLARQMRLAGWEPTYLSARLRGQRAAARFWRAPRDSKWAQWHTEPEVEPAMEMEGIGQCLE